MSRIEDVKVWVGAVSRNVVSVANSCAGAGMPVGIIATPNEVSHDGGYLGWDNCGLHDMTFDAPLGRDHGNHLAGLVRDTGVYDVLHVDIIPISGTYIEALRVVAPSVVYEMGQEERKHSYWAEELKMLLLDVLDRDGVCARDIMYAVVQSGLCLVGDECVGEFDGTRLTDMCKVCHSYGVKAKMHNSDFLTDEMLRKHVDCGVDSFNIGPEIARIEADLYMRVGGDIWGGVPSELRYGFERDGIREEYEDKCGDQIRSEIRTRIEQIVGVVS